MFQVIKYSWKARGQRSKSVFLVLPPDTTKNNPTSMIRHLQSCHFLLIFILCATEFQGAHLPRSYVILGAFLKHNNTYLQDNEIIWPAVQKVWPPLLWTVCCFSLGSFDWKGNEIEAKNSKKTNKTETGSIKHRLSWPRLIEIKVSMNGCHRFTFLSAASATSRQAASTARPNQCNLI